MGEQWQNGGIDIGGYRVGSNASHGCKAQVD